MTPIDIVIDFDGTCVAHDFPKVGKESRPFVDWAMARRMLENMGLIKSLLKTA